MPLLKKIFVSSFVTTACLLAAPAVARDSSTAFGVSVGGTQTLQPSLAAKVSYFLEDVLELSIGAQTRDLALVQGTAATYGIQTSGVTAAMGFRIANIDLGCQVEAAIMRKVEAPGAGQLTMAQGVAGLVEPYAGVYLARWLHVGAFYPIYRPDPAIGPRAMLTIFLPADD